MTGEPRHLGLAKKFRHDAVFAPIAAGIDCLDMMHANTQIPKFRGYQRTHELTGETYWGNAASNFWRFVALERSYANGGNSYHEHFHPRDKFEEAMRVTPGQLKLAVNGQPIPAKSRLGTYADVTREWKDGDVLSVELPMNLRTELLPNSTSYVAVFYGPILLAAKLGCEGLAEEDFRGVAAMPAKNKLSAAKIPTIVVPLAEIPAHIEKAVGDAIRFQTRDLCRPADVTLVPVNRIYDERYSMYFRLTSRETWEQDKARWTAEEQREREVEALTVDEVRVGEQQPEVDHKMQSERSQASRPGQRPDIGRLWREAVNGGWFSYEMKVDPSKPMALLCTYWGGDRGVRGFDVLVDEKLVASEGVIDKPGEFVQRLYTIPAEMTQGKSVVRVKFLAHRGKLTLSVFDCRTLIRK